MSDFYESFKENIHNTRTDKTDETVAIVKAGIAAIPFPCTGVLAEVLTTIIPNRRTERILDYLEKLAEKLSEHEALLIKNDKFANDIFQESVVSASKSLSEERNTYLAELTKVSTNINETKHSAHKHVLYTLAELTDHDIKVLAMFVNKGRFEAQKAFRNKTHVANERRTEMDEEEIYEHELSNASYDLTIAKLIQLNLLDRSPNRVKFNTPSLNKERSIETALNQLQYSYLSAEPKATPFSKILLRCIGMLEESNLR